MFTISKEFHFSASHVLNGLPDGHPCGRLHGHNYTVQIVLESFDLDDKGFVLDYNDLKPLKDWIDQTLDHRHLNDILGETNPTAENLALFIFAHACNIWNDKIKAVRVSETEKTWAQYEPKRF